MDKYEYKVRAEEIKSLIANGEFAEAVKIADTIDWHRVKSVMMLCTISDLYKINRRFQESKDILLMAYERHPGGRLIVYSLCELSIKMGEFVQGIEYYKEFVQIAPKDTGRYILQYKLYEAQDVSLEERIAVLEEFKKRDYREKWAYELAYLYHRVGLETKCVEECDEMILWFGEGRYVLKALELKQLHQPLTETQQEKYLQIKKAMEEPTEETQEEDAAGPESLEEVDVEGEEEAEPEEMEGMSGLVLEQEEEDSEEDMQPEQEPYPYPEFGFGMDEIDGVSGIDGINGVEGIDGIKGIEGIDGMQGSEEELISYQPEEVRGEEEFRVKTVDLGQYNTMNLQKELAESMREILGEDVGSKPEHFFTGQRAETVKPSMQKQDGQAQDAFRQSEALLEQERPAPSGHPVAMQEVFFEEDVKDVLLQDTKRIDLGDTKEIVPGRKPAYATALPTRYAIAGQNGQPARQERPLELPGQPEKGVGRPEAMQQQAFMQQGAMQTDAGRMPGQSVTAQGVQSQFELPPGQPQAGAMQMQYAMAPGRPEETPGQPAMAPGQMEAIQYGMASGRPEEMSGQAGMAPGQMENMQMQFGMQSGQMVIQPDAMQGQPGQMQPERLQAQPNLMRRHKPSGFEQMLSQEYDGQISLVVPNSEKLEKQITGQMNIADIMAEWERAKRENEEKRREDVRKRVQRHTGNMFSEFDEATKSGLLEQLEKAVVEAIMKESGKSAVDPSQISEQQLDDIVKSVGRKKEEEDSQPPQTEKEPDEESIVNFAYMKTIAEMAGIDNQAQEPAQDNGENRRPKEEEQGISAEEILRDIVLPEEMEGQELPEEEQAEPDGTAQWTVMEQAGGTEEEDFQAQGFKEARMETDRAEAEALMAQEERVEEPVQEARGDNKNRSLTPEEKELFGRFVHSRKSREQVLHAVGAMSMEPYHGNVIVTGEEEAGTLELSRNLVRMLQLVERDFSGKVAKISGSKLNKKDVQDTLGKLADGALIIEHATGMSSATAADLNQALEKESRGIFVILEGKRDEMNIFLHKNKVLLDNFDARIDIESLDDQALVEYAKQYAEEMEYSIDELGILALHTRIADMQTSDHEVTVAEVKDLVDDAIYFADKKNPKHFFDVLFGKRYDAEDMIILREKDFMHY